MPLRHHYQVIHNSVELPFASYIIAYLVLIKTLDFKMEIIKYQKFEIGAEFCCIFLNVRDTPKCARTNVGESRAKNEENVNIA